MKKKFLSIQHKTFKEYGVTSYKELWEKAQGEYEGLSIPATTKFALKSKSEDGKKKIFHAIFSSATEDRHGEIVYQVFHLTNFIKNPVYLDSHNYGSIERILGRVEPIGVIDGKLQGDIEFALMNPLGVMGESMAEAGFLNTSSIGFIPKVFDDKGNILESELLEISAVSVPANPEALFEKSVKVKTVKADCPDCKDLPEGEVIEGHDHRVEPIKEEIPVIEAPAPEEAIEPKKLNLKAIAARAVSTLVDDDKKALQEIARTVQEMNEKNMHNQKRKTLKAVRTLLEKTV
jgi:hypothetical protein